MKGFFISLEGIDGSGKSEQALNLARLLFLGDKRTQFVLCREPTDSKWGREIRKIVKSDRDSYSKAAQCLQLFVKDRKEHVKTLIAPALEAGCTVLCDRFMHSSYAFQQAQGLEFVEIDRAHRGIRAPDLTILIDVPAETGFERIKKRGLMGSNEKFEQLQFMRRLREYYLQLPSQLPKHNIAVIDGTGTREQVFALVVKELKKAGYESSAL